MGEPSMDNTVDIKELLKNEQEEKATNTPGHDAASVATLGMKAAKRQNVASSRAEKWRYLKKKFFVNL